MFSKFKLVALVNVLIVFFVMLDYYLPENQHEEVLKFANYGKYRPYLTSVTNIRYDLIKYSYIAEVIKPGDTFYADTTCILDKDKLVTIVRGQIIVEEKTSFLSSFVIYFFIGAGIISLLNLFANASQLLEAGLGASFVVIILITIIHLFIY